MHEFLLDELLDGAAAVASKHGGGCSNEHAPASMYSLFFCFFIAYQCRFVTQTGSDCSSITAGL
jgi:hypothetical protein